MTEDIKLVRVVGGVIHMQSGFGSKRRVDKRLHLVSDVSDLRHAAIQLVQDLVRDGLDEHGSGIDLGNSVTAVGQGSRQQKVETVNRLGNPGDNLLREFLQGLFSHSTDGGDSLSRNVCHLGTRVTEDPANGYLSFAACLGTVVDRDDIACRKGNLFCPLASPAVSDAREIGVLSDRDEGGSVVRDARLSRVHLPKEAGPGSRRHKPLLPDVVLHLLHGGREALSVGEASAWGGGVGEGWAELT